MGKTAIDAARFSGFFVLPEDIVIVDNPLHPLYDDRILIPLDENKVNNVLAVGIHTPVLLRKEIVGDISPTLKPVIARGTEVIVVIEGRQRVRWAREANKLLVEDGKDPICVPAIVRKGSDIDSYGTTMGGNSVREPESPISQARKVARFLAMGRSEVQASVALGCTVHHIGDLLRLLELSPEVQAKVAAGEIAASAALPLAALPKEDQAPAIAEIVGPSAAQGGPGQRKQKVTRRQTSQIAKGRKALDKPKKVYVKRVSHHMIEAGTQTLKFAALYHSWACGECSLDSVKEAFPGFEALMNKLEEAEKAKAKEKAEKAKKAEKRAEKKGKAK